MHQERLIKMYLAAPVQHMYPGIEMSLSDRFCKISLPLKESFFHAGGSTHGSVLFRLLDDAAYFAASTIVEDYFLLTSSFHIDFFRPAAKGTIQAEGRLISASKNLYLAESVIYDERGKKVSAGKGSFIKSNISFENISTYGS